MTFKLGVQSGWQQQNSQQQFQQPGPQQPQQPQQFYAGQQQRVNGPMPGYGQQGSWNAGYGQNGGAPRGPSGAPMSPAMQQHALNQVRSPPSVPGMAPSPMMNAGQPPPQQQMISPNDPSQSYR